MLLRKHRSIVVLHRKHRSIIVLHRKHGQKKGNQPLKYRIVSRSSFFVSFCFVFFIVITDLLVEANDTVNGNHSRCYFFDDQSLSNSSYAVSNDPKVLTRNALLETKEMIAHSVADSVTLPVKYDELGNVVVKLGLGTPRRTLNFSIITTLDVSWAKCPVCSGCYDSMNPIYDPSKSSTHKNVSCSSSSCTTGCGNDGSSCLYEYEDADFTNIVGELGTDALSLNATEDIDDFAFGCGREKTRSAEEVDGYFGLGTGPQSFLSTTANKYNNTFSYCVPLENTLGFLRLGGHGNAVASKSAQFVPFSKIVPLTTSISPTNYVLDLVGISVGGKDFSIGLSASNPLPVILTTENTYTRLPTKIHAILRDEFLDRMAKYPKISESPFRNVESQEIECFDMSGIKEVAVPAIELIFSNGVVIPLPSSGILHDINSTVSCFTFLGDGDDVGTIGIIQQRNFEIIYDNPNRRIGFGKEGCSTETEIKTNAVGGAALQTLSFIAVLAVSSALSVVLNGNDVQTLL